MRKPETHRHIIINLLVRTLRLVTQARLPLAGMGSMHMRRSRSVRTNSARRARMPVDSDDPALTGGGSTGYNELLQQEGN